MSARFIALEGIDQSGKKTQTRLLANHLRRIGFRTRIVSFPVYSSPSGREIRSFLEGRRKLPFEAVHMLYSLNRWENKQTLLRHLRESDFLVTDRYTASNLAYGLARGLSLEWLKTLDRGLPEPGLVVLLDVQVPASFKRKRANRDVHESNRDFLASVRRGYLRLARKYRWKIVNGSAPAIQVHEDIRRSIQHLVAKKTLKRHRPVLRQL